MNRDRLPDAAPPEPPQRDTGALPADGNPNERLEQWESEYFEKPADAGRGDPGPNR